MFTLYLFRYIALFFLITVIIKFIIFVILKFTKDGGIFEKLYSSVSNKIVVIAGVICVLIFLSSVVSPYIYSSRDMAMITYHRSNIKLYNSYIEKYSDSARQQIEEYQRMQSEMAKRASAYQLQFWSEQQDVVGNKLTEMIKFFNDRILENEIDINRRIALIKSRNENKFYFCHTVEYQ